jgi:hypothetical protein
MLAMTMQPLQLTACADRTFFDTHINIRHSSLQTAVRKETDEQLL